MLRRKHTPQMNLKLIASYFIILTMDTSDQQNLCKMVEVQGANYASCSGVYLATNEFKVEWDKNKTVYRHVKVDRFIFYNIKPYYWCIGKQSYLETKQFFYYSGINKEEPFSLDNAWKTNAEKSNVSVFCHEPKTKDQADKRDNDPSRLNNRCKYISVPWTIWKVINVVLLAVMFSCTTMLVVYRVIIILLKGYHSAWRNQ